jgi:hypothetical protein
MRVPLLVLIGVIVLAEPATNASTTVEESTAMALFQRHSVAFPENSLCRNISTIVFAAHTSSCRLHNPPDTTYPHTNLE